MRAITASLLLVVAGGLGCTASWSRVVRYSAEPLPAATTVESDLYLAALEYEVSASLRLTPAELVVTPFGPMPEAMDASGVVASHWADTLQRAIRATLADSGWRKPADSLALTAAMHRFLARQRVTGASATWRGRYAVALSHPAYNADSTMAAVYVVTQCGPRCGSGELLLLARRPGRRWRVWGGRGYWIA